MTDEMRLAEIRETLTGACKVGWWVDDDLAYLIRLLDTARSERDAALSRVERLEGLLREARQLPGPSIERIDAVLSPPVESEYPPEQM